MSPAPTRRVAALPLLALLAGCVDGVTEMGPVVALREEGASVPTAAADAATGARYVAWVESAGGAHDVYLARADAGTDSFAAPLRVNDLAGDAAPHEQAPAQVAAGPEGNVYVLWQNNRAVEGRRFPASDLRLAVSTDGGRSFRPAITVNDDAGELPTSHTFHDIAVAADGTVYVSWIDSRVRDRARAAGPAAGAPPARAHGHPGEGEEALAGPEIRIARSTDGARTFTPSVVVDSDACPCCRTSLAVGPDGAVYVGWRKVFGDGARDLVVARAEPGGLAFHPPVRVHADGWVYPGCPHAGPSLAVDRRGRLHVGWYTGREGRQGLWHAVSEDGGRRFGAPVALLTDAWVPPSRLELGAAGDEVWIAWEDRRGERPSWLVGRVGEDGVRRVGRIRQPGTAPALAVLGGRATLAWSDGGAIRAREVGR